MGEGGWKIQQVQAGPFTGFIRTKLVENDKSTFTRVVYMLSGPIVIAGINNDEANAIADINKRIDEFMQDNPEIAKMYTKPNEQQ